MHTVTSSDGQTVLHFNSDFSGTAYLAKPGAAEGLKVDASVLKALVDRFVSEACQAAAQDAYERAARATCGHCRRRIAIALDPTHGYLHFVNDGLQPRGEAGRYVECSASAIRALGEGRR